MLQKIILFIILIANGFLVFMINKINTKIESGSQSKPIATDATFEKIKDEDKIPADWQEVKKLENVKLYFSYEEDSKDLAKMIEEKLISDGFLIYSPQSERNELKNDEESVATLKASDIFVIIYDENYIKNHLLNQEFGIAIGQGKKIIAIINKRMPDVIKYTDNIIFIDEENEAELVENFRKLL